MQNTIYFMKKIVFGLFILFFLIPTSVRASGVFDFGGMVEPIRAEILKRVLNDNTQSKANDTLMKEVKKVGESVPPCSFGFRYDYHRERCEKVFVPEHGVLNSDGLSVRCEVGYKLVRSEQFSVDSGQQINVDVCEKVQVPAHAQLSGSGDDFQCDRDYRRVGDLCEQVVIPSNGHIAAGGNDFDCNTGFSKDRDQCVDAVKPNYAKFFPNSDDWYCDSGFRISEDGKSCEAVTVPANARRSETGTFFYCNRGYKLGENGRDCEKVFVPDYAEGNWIGSWDCNQGYKKVGDKCEKAEVVENGKFLSLGADFYCDPTFRKDEENRKCVIIDLPQNAEYDSSSYGGWRCKQGFVKNLGSNSCDQFRLPEHGFWVGFNSWDCDAGYKKIDNRAQNSESRCEKVSIPEHAHASTSFDRWDCDSGYEKNYREMRCERKNNSF